MCYIKGQKYVAAANMIMNTPMTVLICLLLRTLQRSILTRFLSHFISGVVFYGMYAPEGMSPIIYSAVYNGSYMLPEMVISDIFIYMLIQRDILNLSL